MCAITSLEVFGHGVEEGHLIEQPVLPALGAGAVVALDIDHQRVVQFARLLNRVENPAHLGVAVGNAAA